MAQQISIRRIVGSIVAVALLAGSIYCALEYSRKNREFFDWVDAYPMKTPVDLSRTDTFKAPYQQTCQISHGVVFYLTIKSATDCNNSQILQDLKGTITINDSNGDEVQSEVIATAIDPGTVVNVPISIAYFHSFDNGDYTVTIDVQNGAAALDGKEQTIYAKYHLCGLERMPVIITGFTALLFFIPGIIIALMTTKGFVKHGLAKPQIDTEETPGPDQENKSNNNRTPNKPGPADR